MKFEDLDLSYSILDALDAMHFSECTPIQEKAIPVILEGHDLIAVAQTGTGKTAAYLLPVIDLIADSDLPADSVNCVIMAPTRELVQQIDRQMEGFSYYMNVSSLPIYGGTDGSTFVQQERGLRTGADVIIATPGRLLAHMQMGYVDLSNVSYFVLDEADRMLDMGFYDDIMQIVRSLPAQRQTLMFSATMPPKIQQMAKDILNNPVEVKIAVSRPTDKVRQLAYICHEAQKEAILRHVFESLSSERVIVFAASKQKVRELAHSLRRSKYRIGEMHSDLEQAKRDEVMSDFRAGRIDILVATDIVARGIDIDDITVVVNYDVPKEAEDYIHRIGRTARANRGGTAVTFVGGRDQNKFGIIERFLGNPVEKVPVPEAIGETPVYEPFRKSGAKTRNKFSRYGKRKNNREGRPDRQKRVNRAARNGNAAGKKQDK